MINGKSFFDQPINSDHKTYENIRKIATGQGNDYTTGCLLDYFYFKENYRMIAIDLANNKLLMQIQEQFIKLVLHQIWIEMKIQQCSLLLKKKKKLCSIFHKEL